MKSVLTCAIFIQTQFLIGGCCLTSGVVRVEDGCPHEVRIEPQARFAGWNQDLDQSRPGMTSAMTRSGLVLIRVVDVRCGLFD
ncbi:hypothetical protein CEXT_227671 [Caerostris extrusa]|uniref:Uncharacterized protein n=1 Tax=Caerostris extrusa TaxID=172846 RepID=A0AAV4XKM5_CAEEX|nr:hypothetical protein CEXT_227671 [Caerostris extrusa]